MRHYVAPSEEHVGGSHPNRGTRPNSKIELFKRGGGVQITDRDPNASPLVFDLDIDSC